jgi:hypothetical protein
VAAIAQGIDVQSPSVLVSLRACLPATHGLLTSADVQRALSQAP